MQTNPAVEQSKIISWSGSPWNQSGRTSSFTKFTELIVIWRHHA